MSAASDAGGRARWRLVLVTVLASLWFALVFFVGLPAAILGVLGRSLVPPPGASLLLGLGVIALAHCALVPQVVAFVRKGRGTHAPFVPPRELVASGLYGRVRNPMYLIYALVILGEAILYRSWALVGYALVFWLAAHLYVVGVEEPALRRRFGPDYDGYRRDTGRWLPRLR